MAHSFSLNEEQTALKSLCQDREEGQSTDLIVSVETEKFKVHRSILVANSQYFRAMFTGPFKEKENNFVELQNVSKNTFKWLLDFMYGKRLSFERKSLEDVSDACDAADMLCLDVFLNECKDYVSKWRGSLQNGTVSICYRLSKKLQMIEVTDAIKMLVFEKFLRPKFQKDPAVVDLKDISYELIQDSLGVFESNEKMKILISKSDANSKISLIARFKAILRWIAVNPNQEYDSIKSLIDKYAQLEKIPQSEISLIPDFQTNSDHVALSVLKDKFVEIRQNIAKRNLRVTVLLQNKTHFTVADYDSSKNMWREMSSDATFHFYYPFVSGNQMYLLDDNQYAVFDLKSSIISEVKALPFQKPFGICCIHVTNEFLYVLGARKITDIARLFIGIMNLENEDCKEHKLNMILSHPVGMTVKNQTVYFRNNMAVFSYDTELLKLTRISFIEKMDNNNFLLVTDSTNLLTISARTTRYDIIPLKLQNDSETFQKMKTTFPANCYAVCSSIEGEIVIATKSSENSLQIQLYSLRSFGKSNSTYKFVSLGFLPKQTWKSDTCYGDRIMLRSD